MSKTSPQQKTWLVEVHEEDGETAESEFAILKLDQAFIDGLAKQAAMLQEQASSMRQAVLANAVQAFAAPESLELAIKFRAPTQHVLFEVDKEPNQGRWALWGGNAEPCVSFESWNGPVTTGIPVADLVERFNAQDAEAVEVFTRDESIEFFPQMIEDLLDSPNAELPESTREVLEKALPVCERQLEEINAENARLLAQRATANPG